MATMKPFVAPDAALVDAGCLYVGGVPIGFGASKGGISFDPGYDVRQIEFDGGRVPVALLDRKTTGKPVFKGKFLNANLAALMRYEPGSTSAVSGSVTTVSPKPHGPNFVAGDYLQDVTLWCRGQDGNVKRIIMDYAFVMKPTLSTTDNNEGEWDLLIEARLAPGETDLTKPGYRYEDET